MSDVTLGESDAGPRWVGVRPHRVVLALAAVAAVVWWALTPAISPAVLAAGIALGALGAPSVDGLSIGEYAARLGSFVARSHWSSVTVVHLDGDTSLWAGGAVALRGYELAHRGRLDLSGRDLAVARDVAALLDALGSSTARRHVSLHVVDRDGPATLLALPTGVSAPTGWVSSPALAAAAAGLAVGRRVARDQSRGDERDDERGEKQDDERGELALLERFTYLRTRARVARVYRARDFSAAASGALLQRWARSATKKDVSVHFDVVATVRAHRLAARAVHRATSDHAVAGGAGFRRSARAARAEDRLAQRERLIAEGRVLLRLGVYAVVWASSLSELDAIGADLWREAHEAGVRLERGAGRQAAWFRAQLPGGPGW